jgi:hypothetical protein
VTELSAAIIGDLIGVTPSRVDFDLHFKRFDPDDGRRINLRWHNRMLCCFIITFATNVFLCRYQARAPQKSVPYRRAQKTAATKHAKKKAWGVRLP